MTILAKSPETVIVPHFYKWNDLENGNVRGVHYDYAYLPNFGELFIKLLTLGWNIDFFKEEDDENGSFIKEYLEKVFAPYSDDIKSDLEMLLEDPTKHKSVDSNQYRIRILSKHSMVEKDNLEGAGKSGSIKSNKKMDLRKLGLSPSNAILVGSNQDSSVGGDQFPTLELGIPSRISYINSSFEQFGKLYLATDQPNKIAFYPENNYAAFQMGVLLKCAEHMENGKSLREALLTVLLVEKSSKEHIKTDACDISKYFNSLTIGHYAHKKSRAMANMKHYEEELKNKPQDKEILVPLIEECKEQINLFEELKVKVNELICSGNRALGGIRAMRGTRSYNYMLEQAKDFYFENPQKPLKPVRIKKNSIIQKILGKQKTSRGETPCLVFGVEWSLGHMLMLKTYGPFPPSYRKNWRQSILLKSPEALIVPYFTKYVLTEDSHYSIEGGYSKDYVFLPNFGEFFLKVLLMGWNIDFFSAKGKNFSRRIIRLYLEKVFAPYSNDIESDLNQLLEDPEKRESVDSNQYRMRIFSREDMVKTKDLEIDEKKYAPYISKKKDLRKLGLSPRNAILFERNKDYVVSGEQFLFFQTNISADIKCISDVFNDWCNEADKFYCKDHQPNEIVSYPENEHAAFQMGVLLECAEHMAEGKDLREALSDVLLLEKASKDAVTKNLHEERNKYLHSGIVSFYKYRIFRELDEIKSYNRKLKEKPEEESTLAPKIEECEEKIRLYKALIDKVEKWILNGRRTFGEIRAMKYDGSCDFNFKSDCNKVLK